MPTDQTRLFNLDDEQIAFIDAQVASGAYASETEVVREGLRALQERDAAFEHLPWDEIVAVYDEMKAHPERAIPMEQAFTEIEAHIEKREAEERQKGRNGT